ncbi:hypothetical protein GCM10010417_37510 [Streptomyces carpaticus]
MPGGGQRRAGQLDGGGGTGVGGGAAADEEHTGHDGFLPLVRGGAAERAWLPRASMAVSSRRANRGTGGMSRMGRRGGCRGPAEGYRRAGRRPRPYGAENRWRGGARRRTVTA